MTRGSPPTSASSSSQPLSVDTGFARVTADSAQNVAPPDPGPDPCIAPGVPYVQDRPLGSSVVFDSQKLPNVNESPHPTQPSTLIKASPNEAGGVSVPTSIPVNQGGDPQSLNASGTPAHSPSSAASIDSSSDAQTITDVGGGGVAEEDDQESPDHQSCSPPEGDHNSNPDESCEEGENEEILEFPTQALQNLETLVNRPQWIVPVLPSGELPLLLKCATAFVKRGEDADNADCQKFIKESLPCCFTKLMTDEAVKDWKLEIQKSIYSCTMKVMELCTLKLLEDSMPLLEILGMVFDPKVRYHTHNAVRPSELVVDANKPAPQDVGQPGEAAAAERTIFAESIGFCKNAWLVDFINKFGFYRGFDKLLARFQDTEKELNILLLTALLKPFGNCIVYISLDTIEQYLKPVVMIAFQFLSSLSDDVLKKECGRIESRENPIYVLIHYLRSIMQRCPGDNQEFLKNLQMFRFQVLLRLLQVSSFGGKMNALTEINRLCCAVSSNFGTMAEYQQDGVTSSQLLSWINSSKLLAILLKENLHLSMYVDRLEKIIRFVIKEGGLSMEDLDALWCAHQGKHDAIVKNIHGLLAKLAWDFSPQQLDHLFQCFQRSWLGASTKERELLLDLMRRLAEDDKDGIMAAKVLDLLWQLAHSPDLPTETVDLALAAHVKILDYSCSADRDRLKIHFVELCVDELREPASMAITSMVNSKAGVGVELATSCAAGELGKGGSGDSAAGDSVATEEPSGSGISATETSVSDVSESVVNIQPPFSSQSHPNVAPLGTADDAQFGHIAGVSDLHGPQTHTIPSAAGPILSKSRLGWVIPALTTIRDICKLYHECHATNYIQEQQYPYFVYRHEVLHYLHNNHTLVVVVTNNLLDYMARAREAVRASAETDPSLLVIDGRYPHPRQINERLTFLRFLLTDGQLWLSEPQAKEVWVCLVLNAVFPSDRDLAFRWFAKLLGDEPDLDPENIRPFFENHILDLDVSLLTEQGLRCFERFFKYVNSKEEHLVVRRRNAVLLDSFDLIGAEYFMVIIITGAEEVAAKAMQLFCDIFSSPSPKMFQRISELHEDFLNTCRDYLRTNFDTLSCLDNDKDSINRIRQGATKMTRILAMMHCYISQYDQGYGLERQRPPLSLAHHERDVNVVVRLASAGRQIEDLDLWVHGNQTLGALRRKVLGSLNTAPGVKVELFLNGDQLFGNSQLIKDSPLGQRTKILLNAKLSQGGPSGGSAGTSGTTSGNPAHASSSTPGVASHGVSSSPDSSSDSSPLGSPTATDVPSAQESLEAENLLPGVIMATQAVDYQFLFKLADLGSKLDTPALRDRAREILLLLPECRILSDTIRGVVQEASRPPPHDKAPTLESVYFTESASEVLYNLELTYCLLMPARETLNGPVTVEFRHNFLTHGGTNICLGMLVRNNFLPQADAGTRCDAFLWVLQLLKFSLLCVVNAKMYRTQSAWIEQALQTVIGGQDAIMKAVTNFQGRSMKDQLTEVSPDESQVIAVIRLVWAAAIHNQQLYCASKQEIHRAHALNWQSKETVELTETDLTVTRTGLDVLVLMFLLAPQHLVTCVQGAYKEMFHDFVLDLVFASNDEVRQYASEQFFNAVCFCGDGPQIHANVQHLLSQLFGMINSVAIQRPCQNYFNLLSKLINYAFARKIPISNKQVLLREEILWLKKAKEFTITSLESYPADQLLEGHMAVMAEFVNALGVEDKAMIGQRPDGPCLIRELIDDFVLPASRMYVEMRHQTHQTSTHNAAAFPRSQTDFPLGVSTGSVVGFNNNNNNTTTIVGKNLATTSGKFPTPTKFAQDSNCGEKSAVTVISEGEVDEPNAGRKGLHWKSGGKSEDTSTVVSSNLTRSKTTSGMITGRCIPVCGTARTVSAAYALLVALANQCPPNLRLVTDLLTEMFYEDEMQSVTEWEYSPPVGLRPQNGFVGLKNGGATCYMNSVLQQLFMLEPVRDVVLGLDAGALVGADDSDLEDNTITIAAARDTESPAAPDKREYHLSIIRNLQLIFGHLLASQLQFYTPRKFWRQFRFIGEPINLREQHDAVEFLDHVIDSVDEVCKMAGGGPLSRGTLGGILADQKICKDCPHKYSKDAPFTYLSVDIRNSGSLDTALADYVRGELLEGADAYYCENCATKVDAVKRLCVKKLPKILAIQLKRFDYDWEKEAAVKFNDLFEFPRELDMEPYTICGLLKKQGELVAADPDALNTVGTKYRLVGVVVHSGQASGGHYYSYILRRSPDGSTKWFKFDDGDVSEANLEDDEELRNQCFGGEHMTEVYDHMVKRMAVRRQKRWWNGYILFYEQIDTSVDSLANQASQMSISIRLREMPSGVERAVRLQNMRALHQRQQFSPEYFLFVKRLCSSNLAALAVSCQPEQLHVILPERCDEVAVLSVQLVSRFLFMTGLHAKKSLRGPSSDWVELLVSWFKLSQRARVWFVRTQLMAHEDRFSCYMLECPHSEVRILFCRLMAQLAQITQKDGIQLLRNVSGGTSGDSLVLPVSVTELLKKNWADRTNAVDEGIEEISIAENVTLADYLLRKMLSLMYKEVAEFGRHLSQYFALFHCYSTLGIQSRLKLLELEVPLKFMQLACEEGPGPPIRYQYPDFTKLYITVSFLIRSYDVSTACEASGNATVQPNPYRESIPGPLAGALPLPTSVATFLCDRQRSYVKKIIEDAPKLEDNIKLLRYLCWENQRFSFVVLNEIFTVLFHTMIQELRPCLELLLHLLLMEDSWQAIRILGTLKGVNMEGSSHSECFGLFELLFRHRMSSPRRSYFIIKALTNLFGACPLAIELLGKSGDLKRRWNQAVKWLHEEMEGSRPQYPQYNYNPSWSPPVQSNEASSSFYLERSNSARLTLEKATEILRDHCADESEEEPETVSDSGEEMSEDEMLGSNNGEDVAEFQTRPRTERFVVDVLDKRRFQTPGTSGAIGLGPGSGSRQVSIEDEGLPPAVPGVDLPIRMPEIPSYSQVISAGSVPCGSGVFPVGGSGHSSLPTSSSVSGSNSPPFGVGTNTGGSSAIMTPVSPPSGTVDSGLGGEGFRGVPVQSQATASLLQSPTKWRPQAPAANQSGNSVAGGCGLVKSRSLTSALSTTVDALLAGGREGNMSGMVGVGGGHKVLHEAPPPPYSLVTQENLSVLVTNSCNSSCNPCESHSSSSSGLVTSSAITENRPGGVGLGGLTPSIHQPQTTPVSAIGTVDEHPADPLNVKTKPPPPMTSEL